MRVPESCAKCLYDRQVNRVNDETYLSRIREIIDNRKNTDSSPYLVYLFNQVYKEMFGPAQSYSDVKKKYNDLVLGLEDEIRDKIENSQDPLATSLQYARIGNYIDFGAMSSVDENEFLSLFENPEMSENDKQVYHSFVSRCKAANLCKCDLFINRFHVPRLTGIFIEE